MAYQAGDTILDNEYLAFVTNSSDPFGYNHFAGTGATVYGLGQTAIATVTAGDTITAAQWNSLFTGMTNIANHTNDTLTSATAVSTGNTIAIKSALITDLATLSASVAAGSPNAVIGGGLTLSGELQSSVADARWNGSHTVEQSVTFSSADEMRWFFNAGGKIRTLVTRNADGGTSTSTSKDASMDALITALGNFDIGAQASTRSGSGETGTDESLEGFHALGTGYTTLIKLTQDDGSYSGNMSIEILAKLDAAVGSATVITVKTILDDAEVAGDEATGLDFEYTDGNTSSVDQYANFIGVTDVALHTINPNTSEGLATAYTPLSTAPVTNVTVQ
jgi:hypothetical protein